MSKRLGKTPVVTRQDSLQHPRERADRVERGTSVEARVQVALAGPQREMQVAEPARRDVERRHVPGDHGAVEDHARVRAALVRREVVDDRVAAGLLLAVAREADVQG